jgi:hypothetical protein
MTVTHQVLQVLSVVLAVILTQVASTGQTGVQNLAEQSIPHWGSG